MAVTCSGDVLDDVILRIKAEFLEMPGLKLTVRQAQRLWALDPETCRALIDELTASNFLTRTRDGAIMRRTDSV